MAEIPYRFVTDSRVEELITGHAGLEPGQETDHVVAIAGRLMLRRVQGKLAFATLDDGSGRIQLFAPSKTTPEFEQFCDLNLGDWVGITGVVMTTRRGELSVRVDSWVVLAEARRPFPDKWHGISDVDTRYRQRYVDLWVTPEARQTFLMRSRMMSLTRSFLEQRGFIEVETPIFHPIPGGANARPFTTHHNALDLDLYLRVAPELYLKRLTVAGFEKVFEIGRVFRNEGVSTRHNPEFTMLELYQAYADYDDIMSLVEELVEQLAVELTGSTVLMVADQELDVARPWRRATMIELIEESIGVTLSLDMSLEELRAIAKQHEVQVKDTFGPGKLMLEIYEKTTEGALWGPVFVTEYPAEVSPLSREHRDKPGMTERFEAILAGRELCNAFTELVDPEQQRSRFEDQAAQNAQGDDEAMMVDEDYIRALEYGLPPTGGLGIGMDRLAMLLTGASSIRDVVLFPTLRPEQ
ncbi:MAG TPA: lysine--tRNA ligase [Acidimicrobiales bacterium]|jgi:lysyl-tRNA synthetase class 2|nr:lysine--tRNA ligase [Acidimicrobiales bacterium]|tara:strand:- start:3170 stop:4573 length:1404 start_codon:yes stop_codon:yes gene_type:complete